MLFYDRDALMESAARCVAKGKLEKAIGKYRKILTREPEDKDALGLVGELLFQIGNKRLGFRCFEQAANLYLSAGETAKAVTMYNKMLRHDPDNDTLLATVSDIYQRDGKIREAVGILLNAAKRREKIEPSQAIFFYEKIIKLDPENLEAIENLADHYAKQKLLSKARDLHLTAGNLLFERKNYARACLHLYEVHQMEPANRDVAMTILNGLMKLNSFEDAFLLLNSMAEDGGESDPQLLPYRLQILFELSRKDDLLGLLHKLFMIAPKGDEILFQFVDLATTRRNFGMAMDIIGLLDLSRYHEFGGRLTEALQRILAEDESNTQALQKLVEFKLFVGDLQAVLNLYPKLYELFLRQSEVRKAYHLLEKWLNLDEENEWIRHEMRRLKLALDEETYGKADLIRGKLEEIGLGDVIQMLESARKTGVLRIRFTDREGQIFFHDGAMFHANFKDKTGQGAIIELFKLVGGDFMFDPKLPPNPPETLRGSNTGIVLEALRIIDEEKARLREGVPFEEISL